ncbi:ribonuclease DdI-like [Tropilaelaps mercedesae]|uniref:Ribonuclease DdI-like n=1 Tax=Tropilaelaps mercedesae TaxID=418985 RepID=A0A1V9XMG9_9ACAR|nr:ribonuclease DdI-like [Tropilaelaps mercedesae]
MSYVSSALGYHQCLRSSKRDHWTIHGLWPANNHQSPEFCSMEKFDGRQLESLKAQLNRYWPSFTTREDRYFTFWRHEWQKHGTCAEDIPQLQGLTNFFKTALALFQKYDVKEYLHNSNINPSKQKTYQVDEVVKAISDDYPYKFDIVCNNVQSTPQSVLSEVRFCFDKDLHPMNCRGRFVRCGNQLQYPPYE